MPFDEQQIESRIDRVVTGEMTISHAVGGVALNTFNELFEFSKAMATAKIAVPKHCRGEPGVCMALCVQAFEWRMSPFAVANKSYSVNDRLAYESQLVHAVVEARAPLEKRLRDKFTGEGPERQCTISGTLKGDATPFEITSPMLKDIKVKNSPLWTSDPDQQLFYYTTRAWARRYVPDVLLGIYTADEIAAIGEGPDAALDVTPGKSELASRIAAGKEEGRGRGFDAGNIDRALEHKPGEPAGAEGGGEKHKAKRKAKAEATDVETSNAGEKINTPAESTPGPSTPAEGIAGEGAAAEPDGVQSDTSAGTTETARIIPEIPGTPVTQEELDQVAEEFPDETGPQVYAREFIEKIEAHLTGKEAPRTLDDLRQYKTDMRGLIDKLEGLSSDELDVLRGRFTTTILNVERGLAKKKGGKR